MVDNFSYHNPVDIHFGPNSLQKLPEIIQDRKTILITSQIFTSLGVVDQIKKIAPITKVFDDINILPTFELLENVYNKVWKAQPSAQKNFDLILALGGGSVLDSAKIISVFNGNKVQPSAKAQPSTRDFSFVEKLTRGSIKKEGYQRVPVIGIPTTAGTSSDVTPWATAWDNFENKKYSLHLPDLWCEATICDPSLTLSMPKGLTIQTALDALSHSFESIWNKNANPISTQHAIFAAKEIITYLPKVILDEQNVEYRTRVMKAALHAGLAFSNTKTAIAHAMSYYMTIHKNVPHGIACSFTLPTIVDTIMGKCPRIDHALKEIFGELNSKKLYTFFDALGVSTDYFDYGLTEKDLCKIEAGVKDNPRGKNSLVDNKELFIRLKKRESKINQPGVCSPSSYKSR